MRIRSKSVNHLKFKFQLKHIRKTSVSAERNSGGKGKICDKSREKSYRMFSSVIFFFPLSTYNVKSPNKNNF